MDGLICPKCSKTSHKGPRTKFCQFCGASYTESKAPLHRVVLIKDYNVTGLFFAYIFDRNNKLVTQYCGTTWTAPEYARSWSFEPSSREGGLSAHDVDEGCGHRHDNYKSKILPALKTLCWYQGKRPAKDEMFTDPWHWRQTTYREVLERQEIDDEYMLEKWKEQLDKTAVHP